jgi:DNA-binding SARP family transcriptional activator
MGLQEERPHPVGKTVVRLFGGPHVTVDGRSHAVPLGSQRLLAFVALARGRVERIYAAGALWPFGTDERAAGNLRSALWRLRRAGIDVIEADKWSLTLAPHVSVDVHLLAEWAGRMIHGTPLDEDLTTACVPADALELLPGWCDDWAIIERERTRQRVLHAMEALGRRLLQERRYPEALMVARAAIAAEPLRETAQRSLLEAQLAQGNWEEAAGAFAAYQALTRLELGVEPSSALAALVSAPNRVRLTLASSQ